MQEKNLEEYEEAESMGLTSSCTKYEEKCPFSFLNLISRLGSFISKEMDFG